MSSVLPASNKVTRIRIEFVVLSDDTEAMKNLTEGMFHAAAAVMRSQPFHAIADASALVFPVSAQDVQGILDAKVDDDGTGVNLNPTDIEPTGDWNPHAKFQQGTTEPNDPDHAE